MKLLGKLDKTIFGVSVTVYLLIFLFIAIFPSVAESAITTVQNFTMTSVGWVYIVAYAFFLLVLVYIAFSKYGKLKLGKADDKPEYSMFSWIGMLMGAGIGVGYVFYAVNEPASHFMSSPFAEPGTAAAASDAMRTTMVHWGFLPWGMYAMIGLCIGYFAYRKNLPTLVSSAFLPLLGDKIHKTPGKLIDAFSLIAVLSGMSMSVGFAGVQLASGLESVYNVPAGFWVSAAIIALFCGIGTLSACGGVAKGIKFVGDLNSWIVIVLMAFAFITGSSMFIIKIFFQTMGDLVYNLPWIMLFSDSFEVAANNVGWDWVGGWTIFYWAWWLAFSPFVGGFLAKISKGRTVREFAIACVVLPTIVSCAWFSCFGGDAIHEALRGTSEVAAMAAADSNNSLFIFLQNRPLSMITIPVSFMLIVTLIVTSINSGANVLGSYSLGGKGEPNVGNQIFWGAFIAINTILFLSIGGLGTLKSTSIVLAFPFAIIAVIMVFSLLKEMKASYADDIAELENAKKAAEEAAAAAE